MAEVVLPIIMIMTATKTVLLIDAVFQTGGGFTVHVARTIMSQTSQAPARSSTAAAVSPRQRPTRRIGAGNPNARSLHLRLLAMHVTSTLSQIAAVAKYQLPVSYTSCAVTQRLMLALNMCFDASLIVFLIAKVNVTNGNRTPACWEKGFLWWSRFYGWIYLPLVGLSLSALYPATIKPDGTFCLDGAGDETAITYAWASSVMTVHFVLLLGLFVKPMLVHVEGTQSGGAAYREVIARNIWCTAGIVTSSMITTLAVALTILLESVEDRQAARIKDEVSVVNDFVILCLTEIALPLGFSSCIKACSPEIATGNSTKKIQADGKTIKTGTGAASTTTNNVVPVEELPPSTP